VRQIDGTLAFGIYDHNLVCARETLQPAAAPAAAGGVLRERLWKIRARAVIARRRRAGTPDAFPNNDRPGVMLAGAPTSMRTPLALPVGSECRRGQHRFPIGSLPPCAPPA